MISLRGGAKRAGEHADLDGLHRARRLHERASEAVRHAERLLIDADTALAEARRNVRRISER